MSRWFLGLGLAAGAVLLPVVARAQDTTRARPDTSKIRRDSVKLAVPVPPHADSLIRRDSTGLPRNVPLPVPSDTIKAPLAHAPVPRTLTSDGSLHFDRAQIFATGSITLHDLLTRALIATPFVAGYLSAPSNAAVAGDFRRVRVFVDGIEYDALDARANGIIDLSQIELWSAEDITIEQTATEVRVHVRSWRVNNVSSYTRTDISTGDQQTNMYRGFFGKRFNGGQAVQFAAQQYGTTPPSYLGSSADQLGFFGRFGWAGTRYSVDAFATHVGRHRGDILAFGRIDTIPGLSSTRNDIYLRVGFHDVDTSAAWGQVVASTSTAKFSPSKNFPVVLTADSDTVSRDTTQTQLQYLATAGINRGGLRLAASARIRHADSVTLVTPSINASYLLTGMMVRGDIEGVSADSLSRMDVSAELPLRGFAHVGAAVDRTVDHRPESKRLAATGMRAWGGVRLASFWVDAGVIKRDSAALVAPTLLDASPATVFVPPATGATLRIAGRIWSALYADVNAVRWNDTASIYRPKYQTRSELFVSTSLPERFKSNEFSMLISARHEYRSASLIPSGNPAELLRAQGERSISTLLEFRIYSAVVSWQLRNVIGTRNYQTPNYLLPRTVNFYGVRWEFWN
jgi:hypothetical protein